MAREYLQGKFEPKNPEKYAGDPTNIIFRSSWELKAMNWFDKNPSVIKWNSEEMFIPYFSPVDKKLHRYFPDFIVQIKDKTGEIKMYMVEIKPNVQTQPPKVPKRQTKTFLESVETYAINTSKWKAAREWCSNNGMIFMILDEYSLGIKKK